MGTTVSTSVGCAYDAGPQCFPLYLAITSVAGLLTGDALLCCEAITEESQGNSGNSQGNSGNNSGNSGNNNNPDTLKVKFYLDGIDDNTILMFKANGRDKLSEDNIDDEFTITEQSIQANQIKAGPIAIVNQVDKVYYAFGGAADGDGFDVAYVDKASLLFTEDGVQATILGDVSQGVANIFN